MKKLSVLLSLFWFVQTYSIVPDDSVKRLGLDVRQQTFADQDIREQQQHLQEQVELAHRQINDRKAKVFDGLSDETQSNVYDLIRDGRGTFVQSESKIGMIPDKDTLQRIHNLQSLRLLHQQDPVKYPMRKKVDNDVINLEQPSGGRWARFKGRVTQSVKRLLGTDRATQLVKRIASLPDDKESELFEKLLQEVKYNPSFKKKLLKRYHTMRKRYEEITGDNNYDFRVHNLLVNDPAEKDIRIEGQVEKYVSATEVQKDAGDDHEPKTVFTGYSKNQSLETKPEKLLFDDI